MTSTDSWDAVDVHPICYFDHDIFPTFPKGHEKLRFFYLIHLTGATLWGPDLSLPFALDNDFYRQLRCRRCASNLLYWPWHFFTFPKGHEKLLFFNLRPWMGATLWEPDLRNFLPFTLDNDFYRQLRCRRCASNLLFWLWHFSDLSQKVTKNIYFST